MARTPPRTLLSTGSPQRRFIFTPDYYDFFSSAKLVVGRQKVTELCSSKNLAALRLLRRQVGKDQGEETKDDSVSRRCPSSMEHQLFTFHNLLLRVDGP
jgi:hypothetical protein